MTTNKEKKMRQVTLSSYTSVSTAHGLSYIGGSNSWSLAERGFWCLVFTASITACLTIISQSLQDWSQNKYVINVESFSYPAQVRIMGWLGKMLVKV